MTLSFQLNARYFQQNQATDTTRAQADTSRYVRSPYPNFGIRWRLGDPLTQRMLRSPLLFSNPGYLNQNIRLDTANNLIFSEGLGNNFLRPPTLLPFSEALKRREEQGNREFFQEKAEALDGESAVSNRRQLIPPIALSPFFDRLFGGDQILINTNGFVQLDFGGRFQRIDNPSIPIRQQRTGAFDFDQNINMSIDGTIGSKLQLGANFNNNNSFDFENQLKVEFGGKESDIIKSLELGNVSMPIANSLITGAQNLFGFKTQMQFGRFYVTALAATQRGQVESINVEGGVQRSDFEIRASDYDENRHFFLGHFFRDNYENWLRSIPSVISGLNITRLEVYVLNRTNNTQTLRNFVGLMDLGEGDRIYQDSNPFVGNGDPTLPTSNGANDLYDNLIDAFRSNPSLRQSDQIGPFLESQNLEKAQDYVRVTGARKLAPNEYYFNKELGYLSLTRQLQNDEVLAVSFEFNYQGRRYKVGELTEDYQNRPEDDVIVLKMLRPSKINTRVPTWDLMMKNIYSLNAVQIERPGFQLRVIYRDDDTGIDNPSLHEGEQTKDVPLIRTFGLDKLNQNGDPQPDANFDFVEGVTINSQRGYMVFPYLEPFGRTLENQFLPNEQFLKDKYVFDTLYRTTRADAQLISRLNKFFLRGSLQSGSSNEINLNAFQIAQGGVTVYAGNTPLQEGADFTVDYQLGKVTIINPSILNSGKNIRVEYEKADLFNFQSRTLVGTRLEYLYNDRTNFGLTAMLLNERPLVTRVGIGNEPVRNAVLGFDFNYSNESRQLTRWIDALPFIDTKAPSTITASAEFAALFPGTSNRVQGEGASYIDDFEATVTPFSLNNVTAWRMGATPITDDNRFDLSNQTPNRLGANYRRAKIAWYTIDNVFYRSTGRARPTNITMDDTQNHYVRSIGQQEVIKRDRQQIVVNEPSFDVAYFPSERGMYNYNPNLNSDGTLPDPRKNFGAITRAITSEVDFDKTNVEYIEFWLMDPFINTTNSTPGNPRGMIDDGINPPRANTTGGKLVLNLGSISEDIMRDERHAFEQGLPADGSAGLDDIIENEWGRVTRNPYLNPAFDNTQQSRVNQDVGLDGLKSEDESSYFSDFIQNLNVSPEARAAILADPSADNFSYYLGDQLDADDAKILARYKNFNGMEGNSPVITGNNQLFTPSATNIPDNEDLNRDNTLADLEEYYEYSLDLRPGQLQVGRNNIVDQVTNQIGENGDPVTWYLFRIPVRKPDRVQGNINGFKSIRYVRTYLTEFAEPVVLRFVNFRLVGSQWRTFQESLFEKGLDEVPEPSDPNFVVSVVSIEDNSQGSEDNPAYFVPPGIVRDRDNSSAIQRQQNEQSLQLSVENLRDRDARAVFKNVNQDLINYGRIKMFLHAHSLDDLQPGEVTAFLRLGTDFTENYYEVEVPLTMSPLDAQTAELTWPEENEIDIALDRLYEVKALRNRTNTNISLPFTEQVGKYNVTVVGRPDLSTLQTLMIGIRNPRSEDAEPKSFTIWANELRVTDFDTKTGWAANARLDAQLADLGNVSASFRHSSIGFGGIADKISDRNRERITQYDVSTRLNLDKFTPENWGLELPVFFSFENTTSLPQFDPLDPDLELENVLNSFEDADERKAYRELVIDQSNRRSLNFSNVRKRRTNTERAPLPFDISNFSFTYAFNEVTRSNVNTASYDFRNNKVAVNYAYQPKEWFIEPFKNVNWFNSKWLRLIKDINFNIIPNSIMVNGNVNRSFLRTQLRNSDLTTDGIEPYFEKSFTFDRSYAVNWNLTKALTLDYTANVNAIIDEPEGDIDTDIKKDSVWTNFKKLGRIKNYNHTVTANYTLPFDKIPVTDWLSGDVTYRTSFGWKAGAIGQADSLGHLATNQREVTLTGKLDLVKLYNKVGVLQKVNSPPRARSRARARPANDTTEVKKTINDRKALKAFLRALMSIRNVSFDYNVTQGTVLPGYLAEVYLFGLDRQFLNPGLGFILGAQDASIRTRLAEEGLYAPSTFLTSPFSQDKNITLRYNATVEPFQDFRITLSGVKRHTENYQEIFRQDEDAGGYISINPNRSGNYGVSYNMIKTAFVKDDANDESPLFADFETFRDRIRNRLNGLNDTGSYDINSQDVVIPAFVAAYTGQSPEDIRLSAFPKLPIPGWSLNYRGLIKLDAIKEVFNNINISHAYSSNYDLGNYINSPLYTVGLTLNQDITDYRLADQLNEDGGLVPVYIGQQLVLQESFAPLVGVNMTTKNNWNVNLSYSRDRNIALNLSNIQVTEQSTSDLNVRVGFAKAGVKVPFRIRGRKETLPNELRFNMGLSIRDSKTVQRRIEESSTVTDGIRIFRLSPTLDYNISEALQVTLYFERNVNDPRVSTSFLNARTAFGGRIRFNLSQ